MSSSATDIDSVRLETLPASRSNDDTLLPTSALFTSTQSVCFYSMMENHPRQNYTFLEGNAFQFKNLL